MAQVKALRRKIKDRDPVSRGVRLGCGAFSVSLVNLFWDNFVPRHELRKQTLFGPRYIGRPKGAKYSFGACKIQKGFSYA